MKKSIKDQKWYPYTVAVVVAVLLYVVLTHIGWIYGAVKGFFGHFTIVLLGCVAAYIMNQLAELYEITIFRGIKKEKLRWSVSVILCMITLLLFLVFLLSTLVPQLLDSAMKLVSNMDSYLKSLKAWTDKLQISDLLNIEQITDTSDSIAKTLGNFLRENALNIVNASAQAGKSVIRWGIALVLSVYLLMSKQSLKAGGKILLQALIPSGRYSSVSAFLDRCNRILKRYITFTLLDALIIGAANLIMMNLTGMEYATLISIVVAVTNMLPTFGPIIGGVIGGFILLLVNPVDALIFVIFTVVLQFLDGYVIKPKLFGDSLGVSGLLILISVIVCGSMFGIVGVLLSIPLAAILQFLCVEELLPLIRKRANNNRPEQGETT